MNYYNEIDPYAARWLKNLMEASLIPKGVVDERDIRDVQPKELEGFTQLHFFAGIGGWPLALRLAGWPDHRPVWTGSCPCQPFSQAGRRMGTTDERHLWPAFFHLLRECRAGLVFGEQVASADGLKWFDAVSDDLEAEKFTVGSAVLPACGVGAPHLRARIFFVAHAQGARLEGRSEPRSGLDSKDFGLFPGRPSPSHLSLGSLGYTSLQRGRRYRRKLFEAEREVPGSRLFTGASGYQSQDPSATFWERCEWVYCRDAKYRPVEPGLKPLAHGVPQRVGKLRALGNAIVPQVAKAFIQAYLDLLQ